MELLSGTLFPWVALILGLFLGSFYNVCIHRYIAGGSIVWPGSHCPHCKKSLKAWELMPVLSWILLRGRCSGCKQAISVRYPIVECCSGLLAFLLALKFGFSVEFFVYYAVASLFIIASGIDFAICILPDPITLGGGILAILAAIFLLGVPWYESLLGAAVGVGVFWALLVAFKKLRGIEGMGMGDVKFMLFLGGLCGIFALPFIVIVSGVLALLAGPLYMFAAKGRGEVAKTVQIPFGPFLSAATMIYILYGDVIVAWWLSIVLPANAG